MSILILLFGSLSIVRTPTDIFPNIGIPVISVIWNYTGLPADDMSGRIVTVYERVLTATVNDIEHIESQSVPGYGIVKIYFQPTVDVSAAQAQVVSISQTILKQLPQGVTPPQMVVYNASSVPIIQLALSSDALSQTALNDVALNFIRPQLATIPGAQLPYPYGGAARQVQIDLDQKALHAHGLSANDVGVALARQNLITPVGNTEDRCLRMDHRPQRFAQEAHRIQRSADQGRRWRRHLHARRRLRAQRVAAADEPRPAGRAEGRADVGPQDGRRVDPRHHRRGQAPAPGHRGQPAARR